MEGIGEGVAIGEGAEGDLIGDLVSFGEATQEGIHLDEGCVLDADFGDILGFPEEPSEGAEAGIAEVKLCEEVGKEDAEGDLRDIGEPDIAEQDGGLAGLSEEAHLKGFLDGGKDFGCLGEGKESGEVAQEVA
jgi:hypothetical protein